MKIRFTEIVWDTSTDSEEMEDVNPAELPNEVTLEVDVESSNSLADVLSDKYGYCVESFQWEKA